MDPVAIGAVLAAVAGGAGGEIGSQIWDEITSLVKRPFRHDSRSGLHTDELSDGQAELEALAKAPGDLERATALALILITRAGSDIQFDEALRSWWQQAHQAEIHGTVANTVSGGTQHGPVLQGRDFTNVTFGTPASPAVAAPPVEQSRQAVARRE